MKRGINYKVPRSERALVSIGIELVSIADLIGYDLVQLAAFKFNLLFVKLIVNEVGSSLVGLEFFFHLFLLLEMRALAVILL
jgi:hypothetical protein